MKDADRKSGEITGPPGETAGTSSLRHPFRPVLVLIVLAILGLTGTAGFKSYRDLDAARDHERELLDKIAEAEERVRVLDDRIDRIRNDPAMLERLAREDLGMVHAGDVVIVLPDPRLARRTSPPAPRSGSSPAASSSP